MSRGSPDGRDRGSRGELSTLLEEASTGDPRARDRMLAAVYDELRALARRRLARSPEASIQPTELVHEMYERLFGTRAPDWRSRRHFFAIAARSMQDIIIDRARAALAQKRGGDADHLPLSQVVEVGVERPEELLLLDRALEKLADVDELCAEVVRLRYFVGLSGDETADALDVSPSTVDRRWTFARAWLHREIYPEASS